MIEDVVSHVEAWQAKREPLAKKGSDGGRAGMDSLRAFTETMNYHTRKLIAELGKADPEFWSALTELATNAQTLTTRGAKLFVNGQDRTNV